MLSGTLDVNKHAITDRNWAQINSGDRICWTSARSINAALLIAWRINMAVRSDSAVNVIPEDDPSELWSNTRV